MMTKRLNQIFVMTLAVTYPFGSMRGGLFSFMGLPLMEQMSLDCEQWAKARGAANSFKGLWQTGHS